MTIRVALHHRTRYEFDRPVGLSPHEVRLRPAPHCRTPITGYSLTVQPARHFVHWQQDAYGNWIARLGFPEKTRALEVNVDLVAEMTVINPFDFFVEAWAEHLPAKGNAFVYPQQSQFELAPYLQADPVEGRLAALIEQIRAERFRPGDNTTQFLVGLNAMLAQQIRYLVRMEPGVQTPEVTLQSAAGSCRDSGWLQVQILRNLGFAARFVSGYLIQLAPDVAPLDGPGGPERDFTDLHAWAEVYLPGAGWIGLDATSGLLAGEGHIPLAATAVPSSAAPIDGTTEPCESTLGFEMKVTRLHEDPRVTKPFSEEQWLAIDALGRKVDADLVSGDVRLTHGGEPTFISIDDMDGAAWNTAALSKEKWTLAESLAWRLKHRFAPDGLMMYTQGKWYPGEPLPRWALPILWRTDGVALWRDEALIARESDASTCTFDAASGFARDLAQALGLDARQVITAYEDPLPLLSLEQTLPDNVDPLAAPLVDYDERSRLARMLERGLEKPSALVLPLGAAPAAEDSADTQWKSSLWPVRRERLYLLGGDSPAGFRLPLASLPELLPEDADPEADRDPFEARGKLLGSLAQREAVGAKDAARRLVGQSATQSAIAQSALPSDGAATKKSTSANRASEAIKTTAREVVRTALVVEVRGGRLHVFLPPFKRLEEFVNLVVTIEKVAAARRQTLRLEGYTPPTDPRVRVLGVTPDPGVIEVNVHPAASWDELVENTTVLYEEARLARLAAEKFMLDGRHTGTGGGNHVTLGGATPADSPFLRNPALLKSLLTYWQNHPALSYLFCGQFVGPTSQAPRVDEARDDNLYELDIAFQQMDAELQRGTAGERPWLVDRLLRNLLVDLTGNTHRAEFSLDKLYSPHGPTGRLGLVEMRAFEMPPHPRMSLVQMLLVRALTARFWREPWHGRLVRWGTQLHDRWMLPHFVEEDFRDVMRDLAGWGYPFRHEWFAPFLEFRFPRHGSVVHRGVKIELRQAIEPWHVLGEEIAGTATARYVDSSVERMQVKVSGMTDSRHVVTCNSRPVPLTPTGVPGEFVGGVRFKAWSPHSSLHPTIGVHSPLVFDLVDRWAGGSGAGASGAGGSGRSVGGCTYHVSHPGGRNYETLPVNANEAEGRRFARFWDHGHTPGPMTIAHEPQNPAFPLTLDLRWQP